MKVGVTGHQDREGIRWDWVSRALHTEFKRQSRIDAALTSLAAGSDQCFAEVAVSLEIPLIAVIPMSNYANFFSGGALENYHRLLAHSKVIQLSSPKEPQRAFLDAGRFIVESSDLLFAIWDGERAEGLGGTGDIVDYATAQGIPIVHFEPISMHVRRIRP